jgi:hypothetical protein
VQQETRIYPPWKELLRHQTSSHRIIFSHKAHTNTSKQNIQWITMYSSQRRLEGTLSGNWFKFRHVSVVLLRDVLSQLSHIGHRLSDNKRRTVNHVEVASVYSLPSCEPLLQVCISVALRSWSSVPVTPLDWLADWIDFSYEGPFDEPFLFVVYVPVHILPAFALLYLALLPHWLHSVRVISFEFLSFASCSSVQ